jgi:hypothetical protein
VEFERDNSTTIGSISIFLSTKALKDERRIFAVVRAANRSNERDAITDIPIRTMRNTRYIVSLPSIHGKPMYGCPFEATATTFYSKARAYLSGKR